MQRAKQNVFKPLIDYFRNARLSLQVSAKEIDQATGKQMCSHWFSNSQWQLPSEEDYKSYKHCLHALLINKKNYHRYLVTLAS